MAVRGRPRTFDREQALRSALEVFWERGYDGATLEELQAAMGGIAPPSFYAAFRSKDQLFREAVELYRTTMGARMLGALEGPTARESMNAVLHEAAACFGSGDGPRGCLLILGAMNSTRANKEVYDHLHAVRQQGPEAIRKRLLRGVAEGDLPARAPVDEIAFFYTTVLNGMAVRARDGASRQELTATAEAAMGAWEPLVTKRAKPAARRSRKSA